VVRREYVKEVHYCKRPSLYYTPEVRSKIRGYYYLTPKPASCEYDIVVNIRRNDVVPDLAERYTPNSFYEKLIPELRKQYPDYSICVVTDASLEEVQDVAQDVSFWGGDACAAFHMMVTAKVLVTAKSSFSYSAALLSEGVVYYIPFWHQPLDEWVVLDEKEDEAHK